MIRTLLATTAVAAVLALPVIAQDASSSIDSSMSSMESSAMDTSSMESSAMTSSSAMDSSAVSSEMPSSSSMMSSEAPVDSSMVSSEAPLDSSSAMSSMEVTGPFDIVSGYTQVDSDRLITRIVGAPVYDGTAADANKLGDISDIVVDESGRAQAVIIGVGGFLGIGEKQVAVAYSALQWVVAADNTERFVVETTVEDLTAAPDFVVVEDTPADGTVTDAGSSAAM